MSWPSSLATPKGLFTSCSSRTHTDAASVCLSLTRSSASASLSSNSVSDAHYFRMHGPLVRSCWTDLRRANRLSHAEANHDTLSAASRRSSFIRQAEATVDVLPVVHHPDIAGR